MIQKKLVLLSLLFTATLLVSISVAQENGTAKYGVMDAAKGLTLETFSDALQSAGLADTLDNKGVIIFGTGSFAIFAPSNEAFASAVDIDLNGIKENQGDLKRILGYHVVWNDGTLGNISELSTVKTLEGESLVLNNTNGLKVNGANITATKTYDSGTIYVIDKVLRPQKTMIRGVDEVANDLGAKKFAAAIKAAGVAETLNGQGLMGIGSLEEGPFTIFAPNDAAFDKAKGSIDAINKKDAGIRNLLSYHIVDGKALVNITDMNSIKTMQGDSLAIDESGRMVSGANVLGAERYDNGIIYVIDQVLVPIRLSM